jgi:hypothetical protein
VCEDEGVSVGSIDAMLLLCSVDLQDSSLVRYVYFYLKVVGAGWLHDMVCPCDNVNSTRRACLHAAKCVAGRM